MLFALFKDLFLLCIRITLIFVKTFLKITMIGKEFSEFTETSLTFNTEKNE
jgi:hypothetical protein